ncbi:MAG: choice-of-anchor D domain-containing protein, partial [Flavobacterium sp.]
MEKITLSKKNLILALLLQFVTVFTYAQSQTFNASGTFVVPAGVTTLTVEAWGGGGKGGTRTTNGNSGGGGGGGYARKLVSVTPGASYTVNVGTGSTTPGTPGNGSWFNTSGTVFAAGGNSPATDNASGATGGSASIGDITVNGGNGAAGASGFGGGGGSGVGTGLTATNGSGFNGGTIAGGGSGGAGRSGTTGIGAVGVQPGGGGGGAFKNNSDGLTYAGGNGGNGRVVLQWNAEIDIQSSSTSITDGDYTVINTGDARDFGTTYINTPITKTFTIYNTGYSTLTIGAVTIGGTNAANFTVTTAPASSVVPGGSTTVVVSFNSSTVGTKTASLSIANSDSNENPYDFSMSAYAADPEINLQGSATNIADGSTTVSAGNNTLFGSTHIATPITKTYTIQNLGTGLLNIGAITITGLGASSFSVTTAPPASIAAGSSASFIVTFNPSTTGVKNATITIVNNDSNENPYNFAIQGTGTDPEFNLQGNNIDIADGDLIPQANDFTSCGAIDVATGTIANTFIIQNINTGAGAMTLSIGTITITGANASDFTITTPPAASVAAGAQTLFVVTFNPSALGLRSAVIHIASNDSD